MLKNIGKYLKKLNNDFKNLQKYQDDITYGLDYLFNELNEEDCYEPKEIKSAFDGSYMLYEIRGDKDTKLALYEYFNKIKPYLKDMNILYVPYSTKQIRHAYISKHNNERDNQVNLLMITAGTSNWHNLAVKSISGLLRGITSNHNGNFYCLN